MTVWAAGQGTRVACRRVGMVADRQFLVELPAAGTRRRARPLDGEPAVDSYLVAGAPAPDERFERRAILVNLLSESEVAGTLVAPMAAADDHEDPPTRGYEVPGTFHLWHLGFGGHFAVADHRATRHNDRSWALLLPPLLDGIDRWSRAGRRSPTNLASSVTRRPATASPGTGGASARRGPHCLGRRAEPAVPASLRLLAGHRRDARARRDRARRPLLSPHAAQRSGETPRHGRTRGWLLADDATELATRPE